MLPIEKLEGVLDRLKNEARNESKIEGELNKSRDLIIRIINKKFKKISKTLENKIKNYTDIDKLNNIIENTFIINSVKEIEDILDS